MTNFEKIKNMSAEELASYIYRIIDCRYCPVYCIDGECREAITRWLKSEVENGGKEKCTQITRTID